MVLYRDFRNKAARIAAQRMTHNAAIERTLSRMSKSVHLVHANGSHRIIKMGFCWTGFFIPGLWAMSEGLWRPFAFSALCLSLLGLFSDAAADFQRHSLSGVSSFLSLSSDLSAVAYLLTMLCCGMFGKKWLVVSLTKHGYVEHPSLSRAS